MTYAKFQQHIDVVTAALGESTLRPAVAHHAIQCLEIEVREARGIKYWGGLSYGTWWTSCSDVEFALGTARSDATLSFNPGPLTKPASAEGRWREGTIRMRDHTLQFEGAGYRLRAGYIDEGHPTYDRRALSMITKWNATLDREVMECAGDRHGRQSSNANSAEGATKALLRMVKDVLGVEMKPL